MANLPLLPSKYKRLHYHITSNSDQNSKRYFLKQKKLKGPGKPEEKKIHTKKNLKDNTALLTQRKFRSACNLNITSNSTHFPYWNIDATTPTLI